MIWENDQRKKKRAVSAALNENDFVWIFVENDWHLICWALSIRFYSLGFISIKNNQQRTFPNGGCTSKKNVRFIYQLPILPKCVSSQLQQMTIKNSKWNFDEKKCFNHQNTYHLTHFLSISSKSHVYSEIFICMTHLWQNIQSMQIIWINQNENHFSWENLHNTNDFLNNFLFQFYIIRSWFSWEINWIVFPSRWLHISRRIPKNALTKHDRVRWLCRILLQA